MAFKNASFPLRKVKLHLGIMQGREIRRSFTLSEQLAVVQPFVLRDFLKLRDDDEGAPSSVVVPCEKTEALAAGCASTGRGRSLLDVIRDEKQNGGVIAGANSGNGIRWKTFMDHLRRAGTLWESASASASASSSTSTAQADRKFFASVSSHSILLQPTNRSIPAQVNRNNPSTADSAATVAPTTSPPEGTADETTGDRQGSSPAAAAEPPASSTHEESGEGQQVGLSLMAMLEQTDRHWGSGEESPPPPVLGMAMVQEEDDVAKNETEDVGVAKFYVCCVCMARRKGAAFIPCGHTFCRPCSRELWVSRGNCPMCNVFIHEILDIF